MPTIVIQKEFIIDWIILLDEKTYFIASKEKFVGMSRNLLFATSFASANVQAIMCQNGKKETSVIAASTK